MTQSRVERPRVAAISLEDALVEAMRPLCGTLRRANSISDYLGRFNWAETDVVISHEYNGAAETSDVPILSIGVTDIRWDEAHSSAGYTDGWVRTARNTEREVRVHEGCPERYRTLAAELVGRLNSQSYAPRVIEIRGFPVENVDALAVTTSGYPVALRFVRTYTREAASNGDSNGITLVLPEEANLAEWFAAFLHDVHEIDSTLVPHPPLRMLKPSDWYTPQERELEIQIKLKSTQIEELAAEIEAIDAELVSASEKADAGIRQAILADGDDLTAAIAEILTEFGFTVRDMDIGLQPGEPKHEDLRLTLDSKPDWEAIVEVKGYRSGIKTNDARQIREHRDHYFSEHSQPPDLTLWVANPHRDTDPSSRPAPDGNVADNAENVGAVCALAPDLYRMWMSVVQGDLAAEEAAQHLIDAEPGLWTLPARG